MTVDRPTMAMPDCHTVGLKVADFLFSGFVIFPLTILFWSTTWKYMDLHILPDAPLASLVLCLLVGVFHLSCGYLVLPEFGRCVRMPGSTRLDETKHVPVSMVFMYVTVLAYLMLWRGMWNLVEYMVGTDPAPSAILGSVAIVVLILLRCLSNTIASPFQLNVDCGPSFYAKKTRFRTEPERWLLHSLDVVITVAVIKPLVVVLWVSTWNASEAVHLNHDRQLALITSLVIGFTVYLTMFVIQAPSRQLSARLYSKHWLLELAFGNLLRFVGFLGTLMMWKGSWGYMRDYVLTESFVVESSWFLVVGHCVGFLLLLVLRASGTLSSLGLTLDSDVDVDGVGVKLAIGYFERFCLPEAVQDTLQVNYDQVLDRDDDMLTA